MSLNIAIKPKPIYLDHIPYGEPTKPGDVVLNFGFPFNFAKYDGYDYAYYQELAEMNYGGPDDFWVASAEGTSGNDVIDGNGLLAAIEALTFGTVAQAGNATYLGDEVYFYIDGNDGDDVITGGNNPDHLSGGNGNDVLNGLKGTDVINGDAGNDSLNGGDDSDFLNGGWDDDVVKGDAGNDNAEGGYGNDTVHGGDGDDNVFGDEGNWGLVAWGEAGLEGEVPEESIFDGADHLTGGEGNDHIFGQGGDDKLFGGNGDDGLDGGSGNDYIKSAAGADVANGGTGMDSLYGGADNDLLDGGADDDTVMGGGGNDTLSGGTSGNDELTGNGGKDVFVFCDPDVGHDYISDFTTGRVRDQIDMSMLAELDLLIVESTGEPNSASLELISWGDDGEMGGGDDVSLGVVFIESLQNIDRVFSRDTTYGTSANAFVKVAEGVLIDLPSDSFVYNGEIAGQFDFI